MTTTRVYLTSSDLAVRFGVTAKTICAFARRHKIGFKLSNRAGYRFTEADVLALEDALRRDSQDEDAA